MNKLIFVLYFLTFVLFSYAKEHNHQHSIDEGYIENKGQWDENILFKSKFKGGNFWIQQHKFLFHLTDFSTFQKAHTDFSSKGNFHSYKQDVVHLNFVNSNRIESIEKISPSSNYFNYFIGNKKENWVKNVKSYQSCILKNLYNGIDLKVMEENNQLKYEFHVAPLVDPNLIVLNYVGQKSIKINQLGNLILETKNGVIQENKPYCYQQIDGKEVVVKCEFYLQKDKVLFKLGKYNQNYKLIIDPILIFATYCGSSTDNFGMTATYGHDGTAYSAGTIYGNAYPTPDDLAYDINSNFTVPNVANSITTDVFISKYSSDGTQMLWTTFLGGGNDNQGTETVHSLICDQFNNVYAYGVTASIDFPIVNGFQQNHAGGQP